MTLCRPTESFVDECSPVDACFNSRAVRRLGALVVTEESQ